MLWQSLGLAAGLAIVGALLAIGVSGTWLDSSGVLGGLTGLLQPRTPGRLLGEPWFVTLGRAAFVLCGFVLFALLCWVLAVSFVTAVHARHRQRELLALLAHGDPKAPGALVVDHPAAAAYCLPGIKSQIVVSVGTLDLLDPAELAAVLAHERAHLRARHDLVLIPFTSLRHAFPRSRVICRAYRTVALLVEMMADDRALRVRGLVARELATALLRFGTAASGASPVPAGALAVTPELPEDGTDPQTSRGELTARVNRLLTPPKPMPRALRASIVLSSALLVATPVALLLIAL